MKWNIESAYMIIDPVTQGWKKESNIWERYNCGGRRYISNTNA